MANNSGRGRRARRFRETLWFREGDELSRRSDEAHRDLQKGKDIGHYELGVPDEELYLDQEQLAD